jgi:hypothetical protein
VDTWSSVETKAAWLLLLEDWDCVEGFLSQATGTHRMAKSLQRSFRRRYCRGRRHATNLLCRLALDNVDWNQIALKLIALVARREE